MGKTANIKFNGGIIHTPSDVSPVDGDLNECINLVSSDGELKPIEMPVKTNITDYEGGEVLAAVHNVNNSRYFVFCKNTSSHGHVAIKNSNDGVEFSHRISKERIKWVEIVGNTLVIGTDKSTHYAIYKNSAYKWLGDVLPRPVFDCYMDSGEVEKVSEPTVYSYDSDEESEIEGVYVMSGQGGWRMMTPATDNVNTKRNIANNIKSKYAALSGKIKRDNKFIYPFFIRYATRLYDGSYINHSAPLLMVPSTKVSPIATLLDPMSSGILLYLCNIALACDAAELRFKFVGYHDEYNSTIDDISDWGDIIKGVDLFMSSQFQSSDVNYYDDADNLPANVERYWNGILGRPSIDLGFGYFKDAKIELSTLVPDLENIFDAFSIGMPSKSITQMISDNSIFYMAKQYDLDELDNWGGRYRNYHDEVDHGYLESLETKRILPDEYLSRSKKTADSHYTYNQRILLGGLSAEAPLWYPILDTVIDEEYSLTVEMCFEIEKMDNRIHIWCGANNLSKYRFGHFIYYPDVDCKKAIIKMTYVDNTWRQTTVTYYELPMKQHNGLNGAFALMPNLESLYENMIGRPYAGQQIPQQSSDRYYKLSNNLIMSQVSNPFVFNAENMIEVGTGNIIGIHANAVPMSDGQFGQYPLIVFTTQGVHAVGIANDGKFAGVAPVSSADTLIDSARLGQPNVISDGQSLYFITKRGLMEMRGMQVRCVSEVLNGRTWDSRGYKNCVTLSEGNIQYNNIVTMLKNSITDRKTFNQTVNDGDAFLAFDYKHNRIIVTDTERQAHWFYSIADKKWGKLVFNDDYQCDDTNFLNIANIPAVRGGKIMAGRKVVAAVFNWNESYIQTEEGEVWDLMGAPDENDDIYYKYGFIASRPIRLGSDDYKSITKILHRQHITSQNKYRGMRLYGSTDGMTFYEINSERGASYKYFVVLLYTCMKANERYSYMSVEFEERFQNKLR